MFTPIFKAVYLIGLVALEVIRFPQRSRNTRDRRAGKIVESKVRGVEAVLLTLSFFTLYLLPLVYIFSSWLGFADYHLPSWLGWIGVVLVPLAVFISWRAHADLGENWSPTLEVTQEQQLVTSGIYRITRHPIYTAMWLMSIAQALLLQNWIAGVGGLLVYLPLYLIRVPREEQMMEDHFGDAYRVYMKRTGRFLPRF
jgi:protein-S-isoprenylcysteine O-methyltransferase Ste14